LEGAELQAAQQVIPNLKIDSARMRANFDTLAFIGATPEGGINRLALSPEDMQARAWLADQIEEAGLALRDDDAGNLSGILPSPDPGAKSLLIGSHLDSVPNGGRYDGSVGLLAGLECLRTIQDAGLQLPVNLEVIDFTDDEGCWMSLFGSRALVGGITSDDFSDLKQDNGPFRAALSRAGIDPRAVCNVQRDPATLAGYLELHIEHGTRLERAGVSIGVVTGIVGRTTYRITFHGEAGHSGTTDMYKRRDALRGASLFIVRTHDVVRERYGDGIFNCGDVEVKPGAFNVIPSEACLTVECRHVSERMLGEMETAMISIARECAASYALTVDVQPVIHVPAANMAAGFIQSIEQGCETLGLPYLELFSYAGHAAQILSHHVPSGMIFIPSVGGIGHQPQEFTHWEDVERGANVLLQTILTLAAQT
jgi:hydantoinase/carbamoylase family amidase